MCFRTYRTRICVHTHVRKVVWFVRVFVLWRICGSHCTPETRENEHRAVSHRLPSVSLPPVRMVCVYYRGTINICLGNYCVAHSEPKSRRKLSCGRREGKKNTDVLCFAYYMYNYLCTIELNVIYSSCRARSFHHNSRSYNTWLRTFLPETKKTPQAQCVIDARREDRSRETWALLEAFSKNHHHLARVVVALNMVDNYYNFKLQA